MKILRIISVLLLVTWMTVIFMLSSENANKSSGTSGRIIGAIISVFMDDFENLPPEQQKEIIAPYQFWVRKGAHFTAYGILGVFSFLSFITYKVIPFKKRLALILGICLMYSVSDEIHQLFVPGRSGEIRDVCIDFCGSLLAVALLTLITTKTKLKKLLSGVLQ